jgi:asparagine N-glycosylation enzyme membrane subunit Stt3
MGTEHLKMWILVIDLFSFIAFFAVLFFLLRWSENSRPRNALIYGSLCCVFLICVAVVKVSLSGHLNNVSLPSGLLISLCITVVAMLIGFAFFELALLAFRALIRFDVISKYLK